MKKWNTNIKTSKNRKIKNTTWKVRIAKNINFVRVYNYGETLDEMLKWFENFDNVKK